MHAATAAAAVVTLLALAVAVGAATPTFTQVWNRTVATDFSNPPFLTSMVVSSDTVAVVLSYVNPGGSSAPTNCTVTCVDASTGTKLWSVEVPVEGTFFDSTPTLALSRDGSRVYLSTPCDDPNCGVYALAVVHDGAKLWFSPSDARTVVESRDGSVAYLTDGYDVSAVVAATGAVVWTQTGYYTGTPDRVLIADACLVVLAYSTTNPSNNQERIISALNYTTGVALATFNVTTLGCTAEGVAAIFGNRIAFSCLETNSSGDGRTLAVSITFNPTAVAFEVEWVTPTNWGSAYANVYGGAAFSPDGTRTFVLTQYAVGKFDTATGDLLQSSPQGNVVNVYPIAYCPAVDLIVYDDSYELTVLNTTSMTNSALYWTFAQNARPPSCGTGPQRRFIFVASPTQEYPNGITLAKFAVSAG